MLILAERKEPFTVQEACAGLLAFVGVMFIARPGFLFPHRDKAGEATPTSIDTHFSHHDVDVQGGLVPPVASTPAERAIAVACATFGSFAAATAYATIRVIGKRTHSLVSVNYFATLATVSSFTIIMVHPDLKFEIPQSPAQWYALPQHPHRFIRNHETKCG
jgi:drug/metabolite transporter (DMT)-like permease